MSKIEFFALVNGQNLVGQAIDEDETEDSITIKNPAQFVPTQEGVVMMPPSPFVKEKGVYKIEKQHIVYRTDVMEKVADAWNQDFGSGLVKATKSLDLMGLDS